MKKVLKNLFIAITIIGIVTSCSSKSEKQNEDYSSINNNKRNYESEVSNFSENDVSNEENEEESDDYNSESNCKFEDGTYSALVNYYNPETGYTQAYTLYVDVIYCEVIQINFPEGGWLDSDHITATELEEDGTCIIYGEGGKIYQIELYD